MMEDFNVQSLGGLSPQTICGSHSGQSALTRDGMPVLNMIKLETANIKFPASLMAPRPGSNAES